MNKKDFVMPEADIILFESEDIMTTSGGGFPGEPDINLPKIEF